MASVFKMKYTYLWILLSSSMKAAMSQCSGTPLTVYASEIPTKFESPGYPTSYANDLTCQWLIDSGVAGQSILLYSDNVDIVCAFGDFIHIYDGSTNLDTPLTSNLCGSSFPSDDYISSDRYVLVEFISSNLTNGLGAGFELTYLSAANTDSLCLAGTGCTAEYILSASTTPQYLISGNFPIEYDFNSSCRWLLSASNSVSTLNVELVYSDIEKSINCKWDELVLYDGAYVCEHQVLAVDCSARTSADATPTVYTSTGDVILVTFRSDTNTQGRGFVIKYTENFVNTTTSAPCTTPSTTATPSTTPSTTTAPSTTPSTTAAPSTTPATTTDVVTTAASVESVKTKTETKTELNIPLMAASFVAGAAFVLSILAAIWFYKFMKTKKKPKKGLTTVHSIAPLPSRRTAFAPRQHANVLSF